nr:universal stress protein [Saprospiraceae bacterium]
QAAATLAAVLVGYNIILGENPDGTPIRLLSESVLNGTIVMILVTCTIATFQAQKGAKNLALKEASEEDYDDQEIQEKILIPVSNPETIDEMINLAVTIKSKKNKSPLHALSIIDSNNMDGTAEKSAKKALNMASISGAATDIMVNELLRYDVNIVNGISNVVKEHRISDLILGLHKQKNISDAFLGSLTEGILSKTNTTTLIYKPYQPFGTIRRHLIIVPENAENEIGFPFWLLKVWNIARNSSAKLVFYGTESVLNIIKEIQTSHPIQSEFIHFDDWDDFLILSRDIQPNDNLIILMSRKDKPSFHTHMLKIPSYLGKYFPKNSFIMIYPMQQGVAESNMMDLTNPTFLEPLVKLDEIGKTIIKLFKGK